MKPELRALLTPSTLATGRGRVVPALVLVGLGLVALSPWRMYTTGAGRITSVDPSERIQEINAPVSGFIRTWHVKEGAAVRKGDPIVDLVDGDPGLMDRIIRERQAAEAAVAASRLALDTARTNLARQQALFEEGLAARKEYEKAKIEVSKLSVEVSKALATLTKSETQVSRQHMQSVVAPRDGTVLRILPGEGNQFINSADTLAVFAPDVSSVAAEIWVPGNDLPFVQVGQEARIQFEGWPSVQIPGWPSVAIGTFGGRVRLVDHATSYRGKARVLIVPGPGEWPSREFLRLNANARAVVRLGRTFVLKELWRKLNGFPPNEEPLRDELSRLFSGKKSGKDDGSGGKGAGGE